MATSVKISGENISYEAEPNAGINIGNGEHWWGTLIKWRRGTSGRWNRINAIDVHPMDTKTVEAALKAYVTGDHRVRL